jgi:hypothetical protein
MSAAIPAEAAGIMRKNRTILENIYKALENALTDEIRLLGKTPNSALIIAGLLENYYTCLETIFLRISQYFENNLRPDKWHMDLLEKMTVRIEGVRIPAVSRENHTNLLELLKFRHFRRYYFELEHDWDKLDFLVLKIKKAHPVVLRDLQTFLEFLDSI